MGRNYPIAHFTRQLPEEASGGSPACSLANMWRNPYSKTLRTTDEGVRRLVEDVPMPTLLIIAVALVAVINLRFLLPGFLAFFGLWTPAARL